MAVELAETLVSDAGLSFRESYKVAADLVNFVIQKGQTLDKLTPEDVQASAQKLYGRKVKITNATIEKATDPRQSLLRRKSLGSPHPNEVKRMLKEHSEYTNMRRVELTKTRKKIDDALQNLQATANKYF
jgi:argininosuccinate lyase